MSCWLLCCCPTPRRAYCSYADALFPPLWMGLIACLAALQLLPLWQLCLLAVGTFWGGLWLMAIKWAGVPPKQLGLSRVTPMLTVCLELMCTGAWVGGWRVEGRLLMDGLRVPGTDVHRCMGGGWRERACPSHCACLLKQWHAWPCTRRSWRNAASASRTHTPPWSAGVSSEYDDANDSAAACCLLTYPAGAFVTQVLPVMWLGHSLVCMVLLLSCLATVALHLTAYLQDPGYTPLPDAGEQYREHFQTFKLCHNLTYVPTDRDCCPTPFVS